MFNRDSLNGTGLIGIYYAPNTGAGSGGRDTLKQSLNPVGITQDPKAVLERQIEQICRAVSERHFKVQQYYPGNGCLSELRAVIEALFPETSVPGMEATEKFGKELRAHLEYINSAKPEEINHAVWGNALKASFDDYLRSEVDSLIRLNDRWRILTGTNNTTVSGVLGSASNPHQNGKSISESAVDKVQNQLKQISDKSRDFLELVNKRDNQDLLKLTPSDQPLGPNIGGLLKGGATRIFSGLVYGAGTIGLLQSGSHVLSQWKAIQPVTAPYIKFVTFNMPFDPFTPTGWLSGIWGALKGGWDLLSTLGSGSFADFGMKVASGVPTAITTSFLLGGMIYGIKSRDARRRVLAPGMVDLAPEITTVAGKADHRRWKFSPGLEKLRQENKNRIEEIRLSKLAPGYTAEPREAVKEFWQGLKFCFNAGLQFLNSYALRPALTAIMLGSTWKVLGQYHEVANILPYQGRSLYLAMCAVAGGAFLCSSLINMSRRNLLESKYEKKLNKIIDERDQLLTQLKAS